MKNILITGGTGYIGSHIAVELLNSDQYNVTLVDNLSNSSIKVIDRINEITGKKVNFYYGDIADCSRMRLILIHNNIDTVIHCAGYKSVGESVQNPIKYYRNNISGTLALLDIMNSVGIKKIIFSSSATVYGEPTILPITEDCPKQPCTNPYGWTKSMIEQILEDIYKADNSWKIIILRYFNPIGAHTSGLIGEDPKGIPNNLLPYVSKVAIGEYKSVSVFGNDYKTKDGTGIRDYIHVMDLAKGHLAAVEKIDNIDKLKIYNLSTGNGHSVLDIIKTFEKVSGKTIPYKISERRKGDIAVCYASSQKANKELNWKCQYNLEDMCRDAWNWQNKNPNGYEKE